MGMPGILRCRGGYDQILQQAMEDRSTDTQTRRRQNRLGDLHVMTTYIRSSCAHHHICSFLHSDGTEVATHPFRGIDQITEDDIKEMQERKVDCMEDTINEEQA